MPHDMNGRVLKVGDIVNIPCKVKSIQLGEDYCNVELETLYKMPPENKYTSTFNLNPKQVELKLSQIKQEDYYKDKVIQ